jgi:tRNA-2-methylthio-N6-dimethylallyladenosine synthase
MPRYHVWSIGCQMNKADSRRLADRLEAAGYTDSSVLEEADVVLLNSCVVRESAENRVIHKLESLRGIKNRLPGAVVVLTGCMVGSDERELSKRFPWVDLFLPPQRWEAFDEWLHGCHTVQESSDPTPDRRYPVSAYVPIVQGCDSFCSYCIVPYRRGRVKSRPVGEILCEVVDLVQRGTREICLLGQIVDQYGYDLTARPDLADLLAELNGIQGLARIRFLTSHPAYMSIKLIQAVARLEKVCEHISLPIQSGDDEILMAMNRGYTAGQYLDLVWSIRRHIPEPSISTDVIVGFPGETKEQFGRTLDLLRQVRFDKVHVAAYSPRPETHSAKAMVDDVAPAQKELRRTQVEDVQQRIACEINSSMIGKTIEVLVDSKKKGKWQGRTRGDKLVFFPGQGDLVGQLVAVQVERASPFALQGRCCG